MRSVRNRGFFAALPLSVVAAIAACSGQPQLSSEPGGLTGGNGSGATGGSVAAGSGGMGGDAGNMGRAGTGLLGKGGNISVMMPPPMECPGITCASLGYACGSIRDECGNIIDCADEGLTCGPLEACTGGVDGPTMCATSLGEDCTACAGVPDCSTAAQVTKLSGRVVTPGRDDANAANQLGVPNAFVYILRTNVAEDLPGFTSGIPEGGTSCDRCEDQDLGPVLVGALTNAKGEFTLEGNIPVGMEFILVVKAGRFRRAIRYTVPESAACTTVAIPTALPENPARLPRDMNDGLAVNIPRIAVSTGAADAMECLLYKMGLARAEFDNPGADGSNPARVHLYRGGGNPGGMGTGGSGSGGAAGTGGAAGAGGKGGPPVIGQATPGGASIGGQTPYDGTLYNDLARLQSYDMVVADCEGGSADSNGTDRMASGANVREYVNRGGRLFASHLSYSWLEDNGDTAFSADNPIATGLAPAATWSMNPDINTGTGLGQVSIDRPQASPRIQSFADWMVNEGVTTSGVNTFDIVQPRSVVSALGTEAEEFVFEPERDDLRVEQFSINTPYAAPDEAVCGRVAYSGFHVAALNATASDPFRDVVFPEHCTGDLTDQEKVLLYMLFDLNACVGEVPPPPVCNPATCESLEVECGFTPDGCGKVIDCGPCEVLPPK